MGEAVRRADDEEVERVLRVELDLGQLSLTAAGGPTTRLGTADRLRAGRARGSRTGCAATVKETEASFRVRLAAARVDDRIEEMALDPVSCEVVRNLDHQPVDAERVRPRLAEPRVVGRIGEESLQPASDGVPEVVGCVSRLGAPPILALRRKVVGKAASIAPSQPRSSHPRPAVDENRAQFAGISCDSTRYPQVWKTGAVLLAQTTALSSEQRFPTAAARELDCGKPGRSGPSILAAPRRLSRARRRETHLSAERSPSEAASRVPSADVHPRRPRDSQAAARERAQAASPPETRAVQRRNRLSRSKDFDTVYRRGRSASSATSYCTGSPETTTRRVSRASASPSRAPSARLWLGTG